jgi:hypothetical protein
MTDATGHAPGAGHGGRVVRTLKDGYWDRTEVVAMDDGSVRVRKSSKGDAPPGPWGVQALRREIEYLSTLPALAKCAFPPLLASWDDSSSEPAGVGYELPFYPAHLDVGELARRGALGQAEIDAFQDALSELLLERVHGPVQATLHPFSEHLVSVVEQALETLEADPALAGLIRAHSIRLNGEPRAGLRIAFARLLSGSSVLSGLDAEPQVRLHGDLFLENTLWRSTAAGSTSSADCTAHVAAPTAASRLLLIDPVSVAGVAWGPPLFDLVKYESYASGELPALRSELVDVDGFDGGSDYSSHIRWQAAELTPYRTLDWHTRFRRGFEARYGPVDRRAYRLIDGYFSVVMAANTAGMQRRARLLKATEDFNSAGVGLGT